jgi:hypothetical protein
MRTWKVIRAAVLVAVLAMTLAPLSADACENSWGMTATRGDGQVALAWGELPAGHSAKVIRSIYGWPSDPTLGDDPNVAQCWVSEPDAVVYRGTDRSVVDTTAVNGRTYWYTLFVRDDATGQYVAEKSEVVATPGALDKVSTPVLGTSDVRKGSYVRVTAVVSVKHTTATKTRTMLYKKVGTSWTLVNTTVKTLRDGSRYSAAYVKPTSAGYYRVIVRHVGLGEPGANSWAKHFVAR